MRGLFKNPGVTKISATVADVATFDADIVNAAVRAAIESMSTSQTLLVDIEGVDIVKCGIEYNLASGPHTFTPEDLADAAEAINNPNISVPRIKLGHEGPLAQITSSDEPSVGTAQNLRVTPDGQTLLGDFKGVPSWLADILASAYPSRSIEANLNVEKNGHNYRMVITAVALLGVIWPGCSSIEDIQALYSKEGPQGVKVIEARQGGAMPAPTQPDVKASVTAEDVRRAFYENVAVGDRSYWWITSQYVDPPVLIVEGSGDEYFSIGWSIDGEEVVFDDPVGVSVQYVDDSGKVAAEEAEPEAVFASRAESRSEIDEQEDDVKLTPEQMKLLRAKLGKSEEELPDNATDEQITAALAETPPEETDGGDGGDGGDETDKPDDGDGGEDEEEEEEKPDDGVEASAGISIKAMQKQLKAAGLTVIDDGALAELKAGAKAGLKLDKEAKKKDRDDTIAAAIKVGKFAPARKEHYEKSWDADPEGTRALIDGLAEGLVPTEELLEAQSGDGWNSEEDAYPQEWLGGQKVAAAASNGEPNGDRRRVTVGED